MPLRGSIYLVLALMTSGVLGGQLTVDVVGNSVRLSGHSALGKVEYFVLQEPQRLVVDVYGMQPVGTKRKFDLSGGFSQLQLAIGQRKSRFVFEPTPGDWPAFSVSQLPDKTAVVIAWEPQPGRVESRLATVRHVPASYATSRSSLTSQPLANEATAFVGRDRESDAAYRPPPHPPTETDTKSAQRRLAAPGATWGELRFPGSEQPPDRHNPILEGSIEQGLDIYRSGQNTTLNLFGKIDYTADRVQLDYNRKLKLGVGARVRHALSRNAVVAAGVKYEVDRRFVVDRTLEGWQGFINWFADWNWTATKSEVGRGDDAIRLPGFTWGEIRYPGSQVTEEHDDVILEGSIEQGIDWTKHPVLGVFNTYAVLDYIADSEQLDYNNSVTVGVGARFKRDLGPRSFVQYGVEVVHDRRWITGQTEETVRLFVGWSGGWDARQ